jgi:dTDP-L-rhamnose 4-epimerase
LDNLCAQVHGEGANRPGYLAPEVELIGGDVRDPDAVTRALQGIDAVFHFAAAVGVGQSMYQVEAYTDVNNRGTAVLLEAVVKQPIERLIVASSMSIYGEGLYHTPAGKLWAPPERPLEQLKQGDWELHDGEGNTLQPVATPETKQPFPASVYALSKYDQERLCLIMGQAYAIPTVALRFFNAYGTRQSLSNPYTGVLAIFASRYLNNKCPLIFEDGQQQRDFVSVHDIAQACRLALETPAAVGQTFNVGSGQAVSIANIAINMAKVLEKDSLAPIITGHYRVGDIRHCFADISLAQTLLGYTPTVSLESGLLELAEWIAGQVAYEHVERAGEELASRGLRI